MKKLVCLVLTVVMLACMAFAVSSCGDKNNDANSSGNTGATGNTGSSGSAQNSEPTEKLICGVTEYEPMNWRENGVWTGFETEFALLVGERLGIEVEFQMIDWAQKFNELNSGAIDAIWNGFTATASEDGVPRMQLCDMSYSYMLNTQCVVIRTDRAADFRTRDDFAGKTMAAEAGSAGEPEAEDLVGDNGTVIGVAQQINTFMEVLSGSVDGAVIDLILAREQTGSGDYANLTIAFELDPEAYAIGFRKGDPMRDRVNQVMVELFNEGKVQEIAQRYGVLDNLLLDTNFG